MHHPTDRIAHTTVFVMAVTEQGQERETAQPSRIDPMTDHTMSMHFTTELLPSH